MKTREQLNDARERRARTGGEERAADRRQKQADRGEMSLTKAAQATAKEIFDDVTAVVQEFIDDVKLRRPKTPPMWFDHFDYIGADTVAIHAVRGVLDGCGAKTPYTRNNLVIYLATCLNSTIMNRVLNETTDGRRIVKEINNRVKSKPGQRSKRHQALSIAGRRKKLLAKDADGNPFTIIDEKAYYWREWDAATKVKVGGKMLAAVLEATGDTLFKDELVKDKHTDKDEHSKIVFTETAREKLDELNEFFDAMGPMFGPMYNLPYEWDRDSFGPYNSMALNKQVPIIKHMTDEQEQAVYAAIDDRTLDEALLALNTLQSVPYAVNRYVICAIRWILDNGVADKVNGFPSLTRLEELAKVDYKKMTQDQRMDHSREKVEIEKGNREVDANLLGIKRNLEEARQVGNAEAMGFLGFYLPHQWDYRGRVYHTSEFGHHNTDYLRAMFMFASTTEVTNDNAKFLTLQMANTYGEVDKEPYEVRQKWAVDHEDLILLCGRNFADPKAYAFWRKADDPLQFLAACREWFNALEADKRGEAYYSGLPIALDATQSGIQVFAAMARNLEDGKRVNLTNNKRPGDLYTNVKDMALEIVDRNIREWEAMGLNGDVEEEDEEREKLRKKLRSAHQWLKYGITRKTVKRNCLTWAYSSEEYGFAEQLRTEVMTPLSKRVRDPKDPLTEHPFGDDAGFAASWYLAQVNYEAITDVVKSAAKGMKFVQDIVKLCNDANLHLHYTTPLGFPMQQSYRDKRKEWMSKPKQKCESCDTVFKLKEVRSQDAEDTAWVCKSCGHLNKEQGAYKTKSKRIDMPKWDGEHRITVQASLMDFTDDVADDKAVRAAAPNFIHSLDATVLMKTVANCHAEGVYDLLVVHDSFATTIGDVETMADAIRKAFYDTFNDNCPYTDLLEQTLARLPDINAKMLADLDDDKDISDEHRLIVQDAIFTLRDLDCDDRKTEAAGILVGVQAQVPAAIAKRYVEPVVRRIIMIPDVPKRGDLDLLEVMSSQYAFS